MRRTTILWITCGVLLHACGAHAQYPYQLEPAFPALTFERPVDLQHAGDGTNRLFVVEQPGVVRVFENDPAVEEAALFLDLRDRVLYGGEQGLLGLAFHPDFAENGFFYVNYTADGPRRTVVSRFRVDPNDPDRADPSSELVLLEVPQPYSNHNGGQTSFGPDGYLYIALGDGGSAGDPQEHGQDRSTLLGAILRIDVDNPSGDRNYGIPPDNPFVAASCGPAGCREEIYAYGFRNPWRFSFDPETGALWTGDVGQNRYEEIDVVVKGGNYGWDILEGRHCYEPSSGCEQEGTVLPVWEYAQDGGNRSVTGGFVYRGRNVPELAGKYVYGDYVSGRIWALTLDGTEVVENTELLRMDAGSISSFGVDAGGELYVCDHRDGRIYRFAAAAGTAVEPPDTPEGAYRLDAAYPNPSGAGTTVAFSLAEAAHVELSVFDVLGRRIRTLVEQAQPAGTHTAAWDGRSEAGQVVPGGVYVCALRVNDALVDIRRLVRLP